MPHEINVALADVSHLRQDLPTTEQLHLEVPARATVLEDVVDEFFHGETAVARRGVKIAAPLARGRVGLVLGGA